MKMILLRQVFHNTLIALGWYLGVGERYWNITGMILESLLSLNTILARVSPFYGLCYSSSSCFLGGIQAVA